MGVVPACTLLPGTHIYTELGLTYGGNELASLVSQAITFIKNRPQVDIHWRKVGDLYRPMATENERTRLFNIVKALGELERISFDYALIPYFTAEQYGEPCGERFNGGGWSTSLIGYAHGEGQRRSDLIDPAGRIVTYAALVPASEWGMRLMRLEAEGMRRFGSIGWSVIKFVVVAVVIAGVVLLVIPYVLTLSIMSALTTLWRARLLVQSQERLGIPKELDVRQIVEKIEEILPVLIQEEQAKQKGKSIMALAAVAGALMLTTL